LHHSFLVSKGVKDIALHDLMTHEDKPGSELSELDFEDDG